MRIVLFYLFIFCSCKTVEVKIDSCEDYNATLLEFAKKLEPVGEDCYTYAYDTDRFKYIDYNEFGGKTANMDYRLNEIFYYQHNLTNEFGDLTKQRTECLSLKSKQDIKNLFGLPTVVNKAYNYFQYDIIFNNSRECGDDIDNGIVGTFVQFFFDDNNLKRFTIFIWQFEK